MSSPGRFEQWRSPILLAQDRQSDAEDGQSDGDVEMPDRSTSSTTDTVDSSNCSDHAAEGPDYRALSDKAACGSQSEASPDGSGVVSSVVRRWWVKETKRTLLSVAIWFVAYMIMGFLGGSVAYTNFPRYPGDWEPIPLPDIAYDFIPYYCPMFSSPILLSVLHEEENPQSLVLLILYVIVVVGVLRRRKTDGRIVLQHLLHLNTLVFITRTTTVSVTALPQPNPRCVEAQQTESTYLQSVAVVMGRGFPPRACGDLIYSGHCACILVCLIVMHRHRFFGSGYWKPFWIAAVWTMSSMGILAVISCRSHYTVDAILAFYFCFFLSEFYFCRSERLVGGTLANVILWLECREDVLEENTDPPAANMMAPRGQLT